MAQETITIDGGISVNVNKLEAGGFNKDMVRFLIYGESGSGKTRLACGFPKPLIVDADRGLASVDWAIDSVTISTWDEIADVFMYLNDGNHDYESVILDSLNEMQKLGNDNVVKKFPKIRRSYENQMSVSDWGKSLADLDRMLRFFKTLPMHNIWIAQVQPQQFDTDFVTPQLSGKQTTRNVSRMCDVIGYLYPTTEGNAVSFSSDTHTTKDRSGILPHIVEDPTYEQLSLYWEGYKEPVKEQE